MKLQFSQVTGLAILQPGELLGIAKDEFNLESQFVELHNLSRVLFDIGTEQQAGTNAVRNATVDETGDSNLPFQGDVPHPLGVQVNVRLHRFDAGKTT